MLLNKVKSTLTKYAMLKPGDRVVVAVSGGPDSVCLLNVLSECAKELKLSLFVAHLDHMFRGEESAREALFVAGLAKKLGIPAVIEKIDVPAFCRERGLSSQAGAREVRYRFLAKAAADFNAARIATGHTATDQAETFLLRLLRGAGVSGLSAIPPVRENIIRPLIEITREGVIEYLRARGLEYASDSSNAKPVYTRNRIRLELLPVLTRFNPRIVETLAAEAALLRDEDEAIEFCLSTTCEMIQPGDDGVIVKRSEFNRLHTALRRRVLRKAVERAGMDASRLSAVQIDEAVAFMHDAGSGRALDLPHNLRIERAYDKFVISSCEPQKDFSHLLAVPGFTRVPELGLDVESVVQPMAEAGETGKKDNQLDEPSGPNNFWQALVDYDKIGPSLKVRNRRPGDWFCPAGMGGKSKKLQDFFVDEKVPRRKRDAVPLLVSGEEVLWVVGFRLDDRFRPSKETKTGLLVTVRQFCYQHRGER